MDPNTTVETTTETTVNPDNKPHMIQQDKLLPGNHPATVIKASMARNHNGKLHVALDLNLGTRRIQHSLYCTTEAGTANTKTQLERAFGITSFRDVPSIAGKQCSVRIEEEEYNGRTSLKVKFVNPASSQAAGDIDFDALDNAAPAAKEGVEIEF